MPAQALPITGTQGQKRRNNLQTFVSHFWSWTRQGSHGDTFPDGFSPTLAPHDPAERLQLSSHTSDSLTPSTFSHLELLRVVPKLCLIQTVSVKFCLCLSVHICHSYFPIQSPPLLHPTAKCTMIFSLLHKQNQHLPSFLSHFSITLTPGHYLLSPFLQSSQLTSSIPPSPTASSFSHTPLH